MNQNKKPECRSVTEPRMIWRCMMALTLTTCAVLPVRAATGRLIAHNTPPYVSTAKNLGTADPSEMIEVTIWLNPHNRGELDRLTEQLYDRTSPNYRHWLTRTDLAARFMPTAAESRTIEEFFAAHNMKVVRVDPNNFFVRASGKVGDVEKAFGVQLDNYQVLGKTVRANDRDPYVEGAAGELVMSVAGLDSGKYEHPMLAPNAPRGKGSTAALEARTVQDASLFSSVCFPGTETDVFSTNGNGSLPIATYTGNVLNLQNLTSSGCAYTPPPIYSAYNLTGLYAEGHTGKGQTIGIIDWCGSPTILSDANGFSAQFGLPALTSSNFAITYIPTPSTCAAWDDVEINIDVEWAHAIAPGANINLIVPPSASFEDVDEAEYTAVNYGLANVISGSYGAIESFVPEATLTTENLINEVAAAMGISANFSSGDTGDFSADGIRPTVSAPADSPWATAVGGITLALNPDNSIAWQAGWGNSQILIAETGFVADPPSQDDFGFIGGAGGGPSNCASQIDNTKTGKITCIAGFPKPSYQKQLPGKDRQLPDVSWLADPYTGVAILISVPGNVPPQSWQVWGGTSVACPMFSALWAIANQEAEEAGGASLGLAAAYLYSLPAGAVTDVVPVSSKTNVTASIQDAKGTKAYDANAVVGGKAPAEFVSALWDYPYLQDTALVLSFGTDCTTGPTFGFVTPCTSPSSLHTNVGWDNVTGVGVPNGKVFADSFFKK